MSGAESRASLVEGKGRRENVLMALRLMEDDLNAKGRALIKPNFVSTTRELAATHVEAVRAAMGFLSELGVEEFLIAEGPATSSAEEGFKNFRYLELEEEYGAKFLDLNEDSYVVADVFDRELNPMEVRVSRTVVESDFRVSVAPMKTHDTVVATLALKNMLVGSLIGRDKDKIHQGYRAINLSLWRLARMIPPHLSVIDAYRGMEGDGPVLGSPVELDVAIASTDFLAADTVGAAIMGFDPSEIGYLSHCREDGLGAGELSMIEVVGEKIEKCRRKFRPHSGYREQLRWRDKVLSEHEKGL